MKLCFRFGLSGNSDEGKHWQWKLGLSTGNFSFDKCWSFFHIVAFHNI